MHWPTAMFDRCGYCHKGRGLRQCFANKTKHRTNQTA
jgi:hypothetical protein